MGLWFVNKKISIIVLIVGLAVLIALIFIFAQPQQQTAIKTQEQAIEKIGNISEDVQNIGSTLEDLDQSIG